MILSCQIYLSYELVYTPCHMQGNLFEIRDKNDYPVLYTAIVENIDIFITGDKDFLVLDVDMPEIVTRRNFWSVIKRTKAGSVQIKGTLPVFIFLH